jgi:thioredoxin 1
MDIVEVTDANYEQEVSSGFVIVDFWADWCMPCKMVAPVLEKYAKENEDVKIVKVNIDEAPDIVIEQSISSVPTFLFLKDGEVFDKKVGAIGEKDIDKIVSKMRK